MIRLIDAGLTYRNMVGSLRGINLYIAKQDFLFIVGPTGGGKSSILKLIYRDVIATEGSVFVFNKDVAKLRSREIPYFRRRIGVIFQDFLLISTKTSWENVAFALQVQGIGIRQQRAIVPEVLEMVGLLGKFERKPDELSGGEMQRLCIARAIAGKPSLLIADEPTGNLDPDTSEGIMELLTRINMRGTTVLVATHDEKMVDRFRRRVVRIEHGRIISDAQSGTYNE
ncbi:ATP-binding cassette domain-containing protein [bacterium]|nr:ATP-binding cassette domain-containing protein [bacterium]